MKNKLTLKLIIVIIVSVMLTAGIMAPIYIVLQDRMYIRQELSSVEAFSSQMKAVEPFDKESLEAFFDDSGKTYRVYVFDEEFNTLYSSFELGYHKNLLLNLFSDKLDRFREDSAPYFSKVDDEPAVRLYTCCVKDGKKYYIQMKDSLSGVDLVFGFSNRILGYVFVGYIIICSIALFLAISPSVKQVKEVTTVAKSISEKNLSVRCKGKVRRDEIGELTESINKMADTLQEDINNLENYNFVLREDNTYMKEYEQTRRMLLRNITHDLKTPLAVISSQVEMISSCKEPEKKEYYYQSAMEEIDKLSKMISSVLQLTVEERKLIHKEAQSMDLSALIESLCENRRAYVESQSLKLHTDIEQGLQIQTVREYVEHVFKNYLSNAVQNAAQNTGIIVTLKAGRNAVRLSVENFGKQVSAEMKDKIWTEAFTTSPCGTENTGLGLYIVKEISLIEHTECGFENTETGVRFWFDFTDYTSENLG